MKRKQTEDKKTLNEIVINARLHASYLKLQLTKLNNGLHIKKLDLKKIQQVQNKLTDLLLRTTK